jgi:hypothetical protein
VGLLPDHGHRNRHQFLPRPRQDLREHREDFAEGRRGLSRVRDALGRTERGHLRDVPETALTGQNLRHDLQTEPDELALEETLVGN